MLNVHGEDSDITIAELGKIYIGTMTQKYYYYQDDIYSNTFSTQTYTITFIDPDCNADHPITRASGALETSTLTVYLAYSQIHTLASYETLTSPPAYCGDVLYTTSVTDSEATSSYSFDSSSAL